MTPKETQKEFEGQLAAIEIVVIFLGRAISLLRRSIEGKISLKNKGDVDLMRLALTHYIVNNLAALFNDKNRKVNSLPNIAKHLERHVPNNFFLEHNVSTAEFIRKYADDLERIEKNRHLSTAHLGASKNERLGWSPQLAKNIDEILGTQSSVAKNDSLRFITPYQLLDMPIIQSIPEIKSIVENLNLKFIGE